MVFYLQGLVSDLTRIFASSAFSGSSGFRNLSRHSTRAAVDVGKLGHMMGMGPHGANNFDDLWPSIFMMAGDFCRVIIAGAMESECVCSSHELDDVRRLIPIVLCSASHWETLTEYYTRVKGRQMNSKMR